MVLKDSRLSWRALVDLNLTEHLWAFILVSLADSLLLFQLSSLGSQLGTPIDVLGSMALQELVLAILLLVVVLSSVSERHWRWGYVVASFLFIGYAMLQMASRFIQALNFISQLQGRGVDVQGYLGPSYLLVLGSTVSFLLTILLLRRAYGKLIGARTEDLRVPATRVLMALLRW